MDQQYPTVTKIPVLDTGKFKQWQFRIQQYLQHEHYALREVIEFGDSYVVPASSSRTTTTDTTIPASSSRTTTTDTTSDESGRKSGRTVTLTAEDMLKKKNDVKARTTLLLSLPNEHQLRFSKYKAARELWAAILKTFGGNEATKKMKKNLLKQQYGNFKVEGSETLEQTFNRLQVIVGQLQFMDIEIEQDDLNQKFLTSLAPEWLRNKSDLDTISLDDLYNHLKVYESEVQKKSEPNSQNIAFISSTKHSSGNEDGNTACVPTASTNVPTASASIDEDNMEEIDIKWNLALLSMRADKFWKKTGKKISIQGSDMAGFDKSRERRDNYRQGSKAEEHAPKALMAIDGVGWDWSYMANNEEDHALVVDEVAPTEFALMANTSAESKVFDNSLCSKDCKKNNDSLNSKITDLTDKLFDANNLIYHYKLALAQVESRLIEYKEREVKYCEKIKTLKFHNESNNECIEILKKKLETLKEEKEGVDGKLAGLLKPSKDLDNLIESQRPSPTIESTSRDDQNRNPSVFETVASPITPKPFIKFVKPKDSQSKSKTCKTKSPKKPLVKYAEQYRKPNKKPNVRGNQRNWNNLKSHRLGPDFVIKKKACFNCGDFNHLAYDCIKSVRKSFTPKHVAHRPYRPSQRPVKTYMNGAIPNITSFNKQAHSYANRPFHRTSTVRSPYRALWVPNVNRNFPPINRKFSTGSRNFPTANRKFSTASRKFPTGSTKCSTADMGMKGKAIKPSACWFWKHSQTPRQHNMYSIDLNNIVPHRDLTCLVVKASADECMLWHRRLVTDDFSRFTWTFFLKSKDETSGILKKFITEIENLKDLKVKIIRCDNGGEFRNKEMNDFCSQKRIKKEFSNARIPQQNGVAESENLQFCLFSCFLSQVEPKKISDALQDPSWVKAMQEELLQFKIQNVWTLVDYPKEVRPIGTKWVLKNKKDERGIVIKNKDRLVAQGHAQEEGIDYDEVFAPVARIEAIRLFLAYASLMGFTVYQMDVKSAFLYGTINEEVYVMQPPRFQDPESPAKVYKVEKAMYGLHQALRAWYGTLSKYLLKNGF
nr:putative ribonuclease H-like domain-containing protein [Tanacetum cinerariifolium]